MFGGISAPFIHRPIATTLMMVAHPAGRPRRLPVAAGRAAAAGRLSDHHRLGSAARRVPGHHGHVGRAAARAADRPDPGRLADDVDELARRNRDHRPVRSQPQHRRRRQRHPGRDQRRRRAIAEGSAESADLSQGQSLRHARSSSCPSSRTSRRSSTSTTPRRTSSPSTSARSRASLWCASAASRRRPSASRSIRRNSWRRASSSRTCARRSASPPSTAPKGAIIGPKQTFTIYDNDQLTDAEALERRDHRLPQRRAGAHARHRPGGRRARPTRRRRPGPTASAASFSSFSRCPARTSSTPSRRIKATLAALQAAIPPTIHVNGPVRPHHDHPRLGARRRVHAGAHRRARRDGDLHLPAQLVGDDHSRA